MKKIVSTGLTAAILALSVSSISFVSNANPHDGYSGKSHGAKQEYRQFKRMAKHLDLTDEQKVLFKSLKETAKENRSVMKEKMQGYKEQMKALMSATEFDEQAFLQLHSSYQNTFAEMALIKAKHKHQMMRILTPEQQEKAQNMRGKRKGKGPR